MRRALVLIAVVLVGVLVLGVPAIQAQAAKSARGTVTAMSGDTLTVKVEAQDMNFTIDPKATKVVARGAGTQAKAAKEKGAEGPKLADIVKVGDQVQVRYVMKETVMHATEVRVLAVTPAKKK